MIRPVLRFYSYLKVLVALFEQTHAPIVTVRSKESIFYSTGLPTPQDQGLAAPSLHNKERGSEVRNRERDVKDNLSNWK